MSKAARNPAEAIPGLPARKTAARLLAAVVDAHTPLDGLTDAGNGHPQFLALNTQDRALVRAILITVLRFRRTIAALLESRFDRPLPANAHTLNHILHVAAAQVLFLEIPDSAAVNLAVAHAKSDPRTRRFANLVNAVMRGISRTGKDGLEPLLKQTTDAPDWFRDRLLAAYGAPRAGAILEAHRQEAPVDFTVKSNAPKWAEELGGVVLPTGTVRVERPASAIADLPGYEQGEWWIQDAAASLPARLLGSVAGLRVADLCAAPGGKTAQLAHAGAHVTAYDISANRLKRLRSNLDRLGLSAEAVQADIRRAEIDETYDAVLLDAPCSSTGTVRRHPDVPWTKTPADVDKLARLQMQLLERAIAMVRPGGRVVFSNCSLDPIEGEGLFDAFLQAHATVENDPVVPDDIAGIDSWITAAGTLRTTPADLQLATPAISGLDGFFAARMRRIQA